MNILSGLDGDYQGSVWRAAAPARRRRSVGWCPQGDALFSHLTARETVELVDSLQGGSGAEGGGVAALLRLGMGAHLDKQARQLSGGMRRRLALALAQAGDPLLLVLDEPSTGCDSATRELVRREIVGLKSRCAVRAVAFSPHTSLYASTNPQPPLSLQVLVSTHHYDDVDVLASQPEDCIWFLDERFLRYRGPLSKVTYAPMLCYAIV